MDGFIVVAAALGTALEGAKEGDFESGFKVVAAALGTAVVILEGDKEGALETGFKVGDLEKAAEGA